MITSPEFHLLSTGIILTLCFWPSGDSAVCQGNDYFCHHIIAPVCFTYNPSFHPEALQLMLLSFTCQSGVERRRTYSSCFQGAIFTGKAQTFSELLTKCHPPHSSAALVLFYYLHPLCGIYLLSFIISLITYTSSVFILSVLCFPI